MRKADIAAVAAAGAIVLACGAARAHFVLQAPASWAEQDRAGPTAEDRAVRPGRSADRGGADARGDGVSGRADDHRRDRRDHLSPGALPGRAVDDGAERPSRRSGDDGAGNLPGAGDPGPARLPGAGRRHARPHRPVRRPAVVSGHAARRRHLRGLHAAGSRVHVGRGGRQRQLLLSPLRGPLDRRGGRGGRRRHGRGQRLRLLDRRCRQFMRYRRFSRRDRRLAGDRPRAAPPDRPCRAGRVGAARRRRRGRVRRRSRGGRRVRRFAGRRRAGVARARGHGPGADRRGLRAGRRRSRRARPLPARPRPRWAGSAICTARSTSRPTATACRRWRRIRSGFRRAPSPR